MTRSSLTYPNKEQTPDRLATLERKLLHCDVAGEVALGDVQAYCELAAAKGNAKDAIRTLSLLKERHPNDITILSLLVSLYLRQGDDLAAMAAIETLAGSIRPTDEFLDAALAVRKRLGPLSANANHTNAISLCMISRNEIAFIAACLNGIKPLVDEIVLVDTGSTDRTADIGQVYGAQVHFFKWCNDFSAARNYGLSKATGRWVLVLDADEAIAPSDFEHIRRLIRQNEDRSVAFAIETRNYCYTPNAVGVRANDGGYPSHETGLGWFPSTKVRLFKRDDAIRFHFPVHERVEPAVKAAGIPIIPCEVPVHHYGYLNESRNQEKARNYYELGIAKLDAMAHDPAALRELAVQAGQMERWEEAISLWRRFQTIRPDYPEALINMAAAHWQLGRYAESLGWSQKAVAADPTMKEAHYNEALSHMLLGNFKAARIVLENTLKMNRTYMAAQFMLGIVRAGLGADADALACIGQLQNSAARDALPHAVEDILHRLRKAGLGHIADTITTVLREP